MHPNSLNQRSQERLKRDFLEPNRPKPSPFDTVDHDKKSPASIRKSIQDAADALVGGEYILRISAN